MRQPIVPALTQGLGPGEAAAIALAAGVQADLLLMDRRGVAAAIHAGLSVTGTMGVLAQAARKGILDLAEAFERLRRTNFRYGQEIMEVARRA